MADAILAHGRLLNELLPGTDRVLTQLLSSTIQQDEDELGSAILAHQAAVQAAASQSRLILYLVSPLLVGLLAYVGVALRDRARTLRHRAAFARVIANSSIRFVAATEEDLDDLICEALGQMAVCLGVERAYFIGCSKAASYKWSAPGVSFPPGWPDGALRLADRIGRAVPNGVVADVPYVRRLSSREDREALRAAGLRSWACVSRVHEDGSRLLLGFDAVASTHRIGFGGEFGLLVGLNAIATALSQRVLEQERARLEARLQQARRLETVGVFASGITHNLNNMLAAILGYAEMAGEQDGEGRDYPAVLQQIHSAGQRARELVEQILTFARRRDVQPRRASLSKLVEESVSLLRASLPETVELAVSDTAHAEVLGEPAQLQQVILNLVNNAAQAMSNVGLVELRTEIHALSEVRSLSHGFLTPGSYVCTVVSDHGRGIDPAMQERIFEPFFTTKWNGSGLGLATTREIVAEHGGALHVESTVGLGSRFEVWLPLAATTAPAPDEDLRGARIGHGETVLMIEQDRERLLRHEEILAALGFEPVGYERAAEAEAAFQEAPERFDLVVIGHLGGAAAALRLAGSLRETAPWLPLLLATPTADSFGAHNLASAGISDVIRWPIVAAEVAASIRDCLGRSRPRSPTQRRLPAEALR
jgi:signal transduction histidine kinase